VRPGPPHDEHDVGALQLPTQSTGKAVETEVVGEVVGEVESEAEELEDPLLFIRKNPPATMSIISTTTTTIIIVVLLFGTFGTGAGTFGAGALIYLWTIR
jgi:hypothetical protein